MFLLNSAGLDYSGQLTISVSVASVLTICGRGRNSPQPTKKTLFRVKQEPSLATFLHTCSKLKVL